VTSAAEPWKVGHEEGSRLSFAAGVHVAPVAADLLRAHAFAALAALLVSASFGTIVAIKLVQPDFLAGAAWSTWGSLRASHTQGILFGWLGNAFLAFFYFAIPRLAGRPVMSIRLGWRLFALWNLAMLLPGWALLAANLPQPWLAIKPLEWTEFPLTVNAVTQLCLLLLVLGLVLVWLLFSAFRTWAERPKFQMLERDALYERAAARERRSPEAEVPDE
jgi:cytochrome c oxidase cbb3-type subunit 1